MAIFVQHEIRVERAVDEVFAQLVAVERWPEWLIASGIVAVTIETGPPLGAGSRLAIDQRVAGRAGTIQATVTTFQPSARFALSGRDADGISLDIRAELRPDGGATMLRWDLRFGLPLKYRLFEGLAKAQVQRAVALDLEAFRRRPGPVAPA